MRLRATLLVVMVCGLATFATGQDAKSVQDKLQGKWKMAGLTVDGMPTPEDKIKDVSLTIKGTDYHVQRGEESIKLTFKLLPGSKPQAMDVTYTAGENKGKTNKAIIEVNDDSFKMCRHAEPEQERPTELVSKAGTKHILALWKRDKN